MPQGLGKNLYPTLSVEENLQFFGRLFGHEAAERRRRIDELTRSTGLYPFLSRPAGKLSGGMKQKLGLCCALIHDPDLLILDEPTTGVDPLARAQFWDLIKHIRDGARRHERDRGHRLHGRGAAVRLAGGDGCRQGAGHRHARRTARANRAATRWTRPSSPCCRRKSGAATRR